MPESGFRGLKAIVPMLFIGDDQDKRQNRRLYKLRAIEI